MSPGLNVRRVATTCLTTRWNVVGDHAARMSQLRKSSLTPSQLNLSAINRFYSSTYCNRPVRIPRRIVPTTTIRGPVDILVTPMPFRWARRSPTPSSAARRRHRTARQITLDVDITAPRTAHAAVLFQWVLQHLVLFAARGDTDLRRRVAAVSGGCHPAAGQRPGHQRRPRAAPMPPAETLVRVRLDGLHFPQSHPDADSWRHVARDLART